MRKSKQFYTDIPQKTYNYSSPRKMKILGNGEVDFPTNRDSTSGGKMADCRGFDEDGFLRLPWRPDFSRICPPVVKKREGFNP